MGKSEIIELALHLKAAERYEVAERIMESLDKPNRALARSKPAGRHPMVGQCAGRQNQNHQLAAGCPGRSPVSASARAGEPDAVERAFFADKVSRLVQTV